MIIIKILKLKICAFWNQGCFFIINKLNNQFQDERFEIFVVFVNKIGNFRFYLDSNNESYFAFDRDVYYIRLMALFY